MGKVEDALRPLASGVEPDELRRSARVLWAGVHGIASLAAADKLSVIAPDGASVLMANLVTNYLHGFEAMRSQAV
jgi:hypothetical protein